MKKFGLLVSISLLSLLCAGSLRSPVVAQSTAPSSSVTLYSPNKQRRERLEACVIFQPRARSAATPFCDLRYGSLYAGDDHDWFDSLRDKSRSVVRDLGALAWTDQFTVPIVAPLPELKPGEKRSITVDTSGADGADGAPGAPGAPGPDGADADGVVRPRERPAPIVTTPPQGPPRPPRRDGKPKIDPVFTKAIPGHLYVIHVVDEVSDFYALFRVDALERGDHCTISWKLIPNPEIRTTVRP